MQGLLGSFKYVIGSRTAKKIAGVVAILSSNVAAFGQPVILDLGTLPNGSPTPYPYVISDNGLVVAGGPWQFATTPGAFVWTPTSGAVALSALSGDDSTRAFGISGDGTLVVGSSWSSSLPSALHGILWTTPSTPHDLGTLSSNPLVPRCISGNGQVVAGAAGQRMFRWTRTISPDGVWAGGVAEEIPLPVAPNSVSDPQPFSISHDGAVIVGQWRPQSSGRTRAFRWTAATGATELSINSSATYTKAVAVSSRGDVVVGTMGNDNLTSSPDSSNRAFRWTATEGTVSLGVVAGDEYSRAVGMSSNGSRIIAISGSLGRFSPAIWTKRDGMVSITRLLAEQGADITGWVLTDVTAISADASSIAGVGTLNGQFRSWLVRGLGTAACQADIDRSGDITVRDIFAFVNAWFGGEPIADFNASGSITSSDLFDYLDAWFVGC